MSTLVLSLVLSFCLAGCLSTRNLKPDTVMVLHFVDVGYGNAILITGPGYACLVDGGYPTQTEQLLAYLADNGIKHLDTVVLTHPHPDHIGGLHGVLASGITTDAIYCPWALEAHQIPKGFRDMVKGKRIPYNEIRSGSMIKLDDFSELRVLHPETIWPDMNDSSMVLYYSNTKPHLLTRNDSLLEGNVSEAEIEPVSFLITGDIGPAGQERIENEFKELFPVTILQAPHHGGHSRESFYQLVNPEITVISDGINPYGNPWQSTLEAAEKWSSQVYRLSESGSVVVKIHGPDSKLRISVIKE